MRVLAIFLVAVILLTPLLVATHQYTCNCPKRDPQYTYWLLIDADYLDEEDPSWSPSVGTTIDAWVNSIDNHFYLLFYYTFFAQDEYGNFYKICNAGVGCYYSTVGCLSSSNEVVLSKFDWTLQYSDTLCWFVATKHYYLPWTALGKNNYYWLHTYYNNKDYYSDCIKVRAYQMCLEIVDVQRIDWQTGLCSVGEYRYKATVKLSNYPANPVTLDVGGVRVGLYSTTPSGSKILLGSGVTDPSGYATIDCGCWGYYLTDFQAHCYYDKYKYSTGGILNNWLGGLDVYSAWYKLP
jgi:hypothetical protein